MAAIQGNIEITQLLIGYEADINAKDKTGRTPLHYAVEMENHELLKLLVTQKADVNVPGIVIKNRYGHPASLYTEATDTPLHGTA